MSYTKRQLDHDDAVPVVTATDNQKYVDRGRMLAVCDDPQWGQELMDANRHKHGAQFRYAESLIIQLAVIRTVCQLPYRALEGMASEMLHGLSLIHISEPTRPY